MRGLVGDADDQEARRGTQAERISVVNLDGGVGKVGGAVTAGRLDRLAAAVDARDQKRSVGRVEALRKPTPILQSNAQVLARDIGIDVNDGVFVARQRSDNAARRIHG